MTRFEPVPGFHVNGALTLGENIADIAGIEIAYKAYFASLNGRAPPVIDGMTAEQRFYIGFAQSWLGKRRDEARSHNLNPIRTRLRNTAPMAWSCTCRVSTARFRSCPADKMYLAPEQRVTLW